MLKFMFLSVRDKLFIKEVQTSSLGYKMECRKSFLIIVLIAFYGFKSLVYGVFLCSNYRYF